MTDQELIRAAREWREDYFLNGEHCVLLDALVERLSALQAENAELRAQHRTEYCEAEGYNCVELGRLRAENERLALNGGRYMAIAEQRYELYSHALDTIEKREMELTAKAAALSRVEAERDAAVKDMKLMADKAREEHGDNVPCFACRFDCDMSIMPSGDFANECPGFDKEDCFKWRGAQGGGVSDGEADRTRNK